MRIIIYMNVLKKYHPRSKDTRKLRADNKSGGFKVEVLPVSMGMHHSPGSYLRLPVQFER